MVKNSALTAATTSGTLPLFTFDVQSSRDRNHYIGTMVGRSIFADMNDGTEPGIPDGLKVDSIGRVYCTGPGGIWVMAPDGKRVGIIRWPEQAVNFAFGGPDLRTLLCCAHTSVYTLRVMVPGNPHPWYKLQAR